MSILEKIEKYTPTDDFYAIDDKLFLHILRRSDKAFDRADKLRDRVKTLEQFEKYRRRAINTFKKSVGKIPYDKSLPLNSRVVKSFTDDGLSIENIVFQSRKNVFVPATLYMPENADGKLPTILFQGGHASSGRFHAQYQAVCRIIAKTGFAVLAIDHIGQGERQGYSEIPMMRESPCYEHERVGRQCILNDTNVLKYFISDAMRAIDYIESRPELDGERIGATGNSGGGTMTSVISILDDRIKATAPGTFITTRRDYFSAGSTQDAEQVWEGITKNNFDHFELISAFCPKPYLILGVKSDFFCPEGTARVFEKGREFYRLFGCEDNLRIAWDDSKHAYTKNLACSAAEFFAEVLDGRKACAKPDVKVFDDPSPLYTSPDGSIYSAYPEYTTVYEENLAEYKKRKPLKDSAELLREKIYFEREEVEPRVRYLFKDSLEGTEIQRIMWFGQRELASYGVLFSPENTNSLPVTVCLWSGGTDKLVEHKSVIWDILKSGRRALVVDLSTMGKCSPREILNNAGRFNTTVRLSKELLFLGDSLPALMTYDLIKTLEMTKNELDSSDVLLYTEGVYGVFADILEKTGFDVKVQCHNKVTAEDIITDRLYSEEDIVQVTMTGLARLLGD
ncbi:MAG: acetylxylan esterase [Clostridia bacterium]|nr:acetylxylan esterase [Clostridia bacterium]